jgi:hypothetical protein
VAAATPNRSSRKTPDFQLKRAALSPGSRQAGGGDRDDLGQPSSDPRRCTAQKYTYLSHLNLPLAPVERSFHERGALRKMVGPG